MDKPTTLSVKDWIIRNMSVDMQIPERIIHAVISHQFNSARDAMETGYSVQFAGFGKFLFNVKRAYKKLGKFTSLDEKMQRIIDDPETTPQRRKQLQYKIGVLKGDIKLLKKKLKIEDNENQSESNL